MPLPHALAQATTRARGQIVRDYSQGADPRIANDAVCGNGMCLGMVLLWLRRKGRGHDFWSLFDTQQGLAQVRATTAMDQILVRRANAAGRRQASARAAKMNLAKNELAIALRQSTVIGGLTDIGTIYQQIRKRVSGFFLLELRFADDTGHALGFVRPIEGGIYVLDPNFGEIHFANVEYFGWWLAQLFELVNAYHNLASASLEVYMRPLPMLAARLAKMARQLERL